jgi:hypothetical protein
MLRSIFPGRSTLVEFADFRFDSDLGKGKKS